MTTKEILELVPIDFGGGCSVSKAELFYYLIQKFKIKESVDIGVYRGRSLLPQALSHKQNTGGTVFGVDPYDNEMAREKDNIELRERIDKFIEDNDFNLIYKDVVSLLKKADLSANVKMLRKPSSNALAYFKKNGIRPRFIHIDGNHDTKLVLEDVVGYAEILGKDGFIVMDDISWNSVTPAMDILHNDKNLSLLFCNVSSTNDYAVFSNISSLRRNKRLAADLFKFGQY